MEYLRAQCPDTPIVRTHYTERSSTAITQVMAVRSTLTYVTGNPRKLEEVLVSRISPSLSWSNEGLAYEAV